MFKNFPELNEGKPSKSAIEKMIKDAEDQIENEEGGNGEPLTSETLQSLEDEVKRLKKMLETISESKESEFAQSLVKLMVTIDDSMSYKDFALAVSKVLKGEYGSHNFKPFMAELKKNLKL